MSRKMLFNILIFIVFGFLGYQLRNIFTFKKTYWNIAKNYIDTRFKNLRLSVVMAIMEVESGFKEKAYRAEPQIKTASYGLMQILETTANMIGFNGEAEELYDANTNIYYGMKYLNDLYNTFPDDWRAIIMSYNEGSSNYKKGKRVWGYYGKVLANITKYQLIELIGI